MRLMTLDILKDAHKQKYAVPAFNINGNDWIVAILKAAHELRSPIIVASADRMMNYLGGFDIVYRQVCLAIDTLEIDVPVVLHLDHGSCFERCKAAIDSGFTSVMIDASKENIDKNIEITKKVVDYARKYGVTVEAEVGTIGGNEDGLIGGIGYARTSECIKMVKETGIDALAAALGSVHGLYVGEPNLSFERMEEINNAIDIPLVLHGASGILDNQIEECIKLGHSKININTDCNQIWFKALRKSLMENESTHEPRVVLEPARMAMQEFVKSKIVQFGSKNRY